LHHRKNMIETREINLQSINVDFLLNTQLMELITLANTTRKDFVGPQLDLCNILNAKSGLCSEDCKFCAQSARHKTGIQIYPLKSKNEMVGAAREAKNIGAKRFGIVTSGNRLNEKEFAVIIETIKQIKTEVGIKVCASLGALNKEQLARLKNAGLSRYHHNIETSARFYPEIVSTHKFEERVGTIKAAKQVGLEVCSGGIIGMGESWQDRIDMATILKELDVDSVPINLLMPIKGTALESAESISCSEAIRTICIFRIILKDKTIKIAAGREAILSDFQALAFMAGANGMLIGGYLTIKGRGVERDHQLIKEVEKIWEQ
jgi:biotin synthase